MYGWRLARLTSKQTSLLYFGAVLPTAHVEALPWWKGLGARVLLERLERERERERRSTYSTGCTAYTQSPKHGVQAVRHQGAENCAVSLRKVRM
jgi:hypothetical protein